MLGILAFVQDLSLVNKDRFRDISLLKADLVLVYDRQDQSDKVK